MNIFTGPIVVIFMKVFFFLTYLALFAIGFTLLKYANVLELDATSGIEYFSKFSVVIIVLTAITRWGINIFTRLTKTTNKK